MTFNFNFLEIKLFLEKEMMVEVGSSFKLVMFAFISSAQV
jgi:hypothetical protein